MERNICRTFNAIINSTYPKENIYLYQLHNICNQYIRVLFELNSLFNTSSQFTDIVFGMLSFYGIMIFQIIWVILLIVQLCRVNSPEARFLAWLRCLNVFRTETNFLNISIHIQYQVRELSYISGRGGRLFVGGGWGNNFLGVYKWVNGGTL